MQRDAKVTIPRDAHRVAKVEAAKVEMRIGEWIAMAIYELERTKDGEPTKAAKQRAALGRIYKDAKA